MHILITTEDVYNRYGARFGPYDRVFYVHTTDAETVEKEFGEMEATRVTGLGGGQAVDIAKLIGTLNGCPVRAIPTALSVDAFLVDGSAVRKNGTVVYRPSRKPEEVVIDYDILMDAPFRLNAAGWGDVFSIYTAVWDWQLAADYAGEKLEEAIAREALALLETACRPDTRKGLEALLDALQREVSLCEQARSSPLEEGSEHFFVYCLENYLPEDRKFYHGELVGLGIYQMARLQDQDTDYITRKMDEAGLLWNSRALGIEDETVIEVLLNLPDFASRHKLPFSVINVMK